MSDNPLLQNLIPPNFQIGRFEPIEGGRLLVVLPGETVKATVGRRPRCLHCRARRRAGDVRQGAFLHQRRHGPRQARQGRGFGRRDLDRCFEVIARFVQNRTLT
jgi:hypothetical protein